LLPSWVTAVATGFGAVVTWAGISDRTVSRAVEKAARQAEKAAREAADGVRADVRAEVKALAEKLATNDFPHVERRIDRGLAEARADREAMETRLNERIDRVEVRIGERFDRARQDREDMEARILAAVQRRPAADASEAGP